MQSVKADKVAKRRAVCPFHLTHRLTGRNWRRTGCRIPATGSSRKTRAFIIGASGVPYFIDDKGRRVLDGLSGLWCCGAGHNRPEIAEAVYRQIANPDHSPAFPVRSPASFELADRSRR